MARLFFALVPPPGVADRLDDVCEGITEAHWVAESDFHLTLSFLGEVSDHLVVDIIEAGRSVSASSFRMELESVGIFPARGRPRVLWAGVRKEERLISLQRALGSELRRMGLQLEQRKFHPHVTLAHIEGTPAEEVSDWLARHLSFRAGPFGVFDFRLMSSVRPGHGPRYLELGRFPLRV